MKSALAVLALMLAQAVAPQNKTATPVPQLTETERLQLENMQLKMSLLQNQQETIRYQYQGIVQALNAAHPGFTFDPQKNTFVPVQPPVAEKK